MRARTRLIVCSATVLVSSVEVSAQATAEQLAKCAAIYSSTLRLDCYDALAKRNASAPTSTSPASVTAPASQAPVTRPDSSLQKLAAPDPKPVAAMDSALRKALGVTDGDKMLGLWLMSITTDPITDRKDVRFILPGEGANAIDTPAMVVRCLRGELDIIVSPDAYLSDGNNEVTTRFGSDPPATERWSESSNHSALFVPGNRQKKETFVRKLAGYSRFVIQVHPYQKLPKAIVFNLEGVDQVNAALWPMCPS